MQVSLLKGSVRFVFRYTKGDEGKLIDAICELAAKRDSEFDWYDAAVLSYQLGLRLEKEITS